MKETTLQKKAGQVDILSGKFEESKSVLFVDYRGLTVAEISKLRSDLYKENCEMFVIKNNIMRRAAEKVGYSGLDEVLVGPNAVAISGDATNSSRIIYNFLKTNKKLKVKAGVIEGVTYPEEQVRVLAKLPDKNGMLSMLLSVLQAPMRKLACVIKAVGEAQEN